MRRFLYYVPGARSMAEVDLEARGLDYAIDRARVASRHLARGPDGGPGLLLAAGGPERLDHDPDAQAWQPVPGATFMAGVWTDERPGPADLVRPRVYGMWSVELADGQRWTVPTARMYPEGTLLPQTRTYLGDGKIRRDPKPEFLPLYLAADEVLEAWKGAGELPEARVQEIAVMALAVNYRVGHAEVNLLGLIDDLNWRAILDIIVARPLWPEE